MVKLLLFLLLTACVDRLMIPSDYSQSCKIESWGSDYVVSINYEKWHQEGYFDTIIDLYYLDTIYITSYGERLKASIGGVVYLDTVHLGFYQTSIPIQ